MTKMYLIDGVEYKAKSARDLVEQMNESSFSQRPSAKEYMAEVAERVTLQSGDKPRTDTFENFVADLITAGMVEEKLP